MGAVLLYCELDDGEPRKIFSPCLAWSSGLHSGVRAMRSKAWMVGVREREKVCEGGLVGLTERQAKVRSCRLQIAATLDVWMGSRGATVDATCNGTVVQGRFEGGIVS